MLPDRVERERADAERRADFDPAESAGLFVGVSRFEDEWLPAIPFAVDDAVDLAHLFAVELGLILPERTVLLLAGEPQKPESIKWLAQLIERGASQRSARTPDIYRYLGKLTRDTGERGLFVLALATHGISDQAGSFLVAADSVREHILRTSVPVSDVFDQVAYIGTRRSLVLLDACRDRPSDRTRGEEGFAMTQSFATAIARAKGSVVLSGATLGGFAYDDKLRKNGVFTAAVLDGLRGEAPAGPEGWITVRTLADFVQQRVVAWVRRNRPDHVTKSRGIGRWIEATAEELPLAPHPEALRERQRYVMRREKALALVKENQGKVLTGEYCDQIYSLLPAERPSLDSESLLVVIEFLDGTEPPQEILRNFLRGLKSPGFGKSATEGWKKAQWRIAGTVAVALAMTVVAFYLWVQWQAKTERSIHPTEPTHRPLPQATAPLTSNPAPTVADIQPPIKIPHIGLTATAEREPYSPEVYPVRLSWQAPISGIQFDIVRSLLDHNEDKELVPVPWLLGVSGHGPMHGPNQMYRDLGVRPLTTYVYTVRFLTTSQPQESVKIKTHGHEVEIGSGDIKKLSDLDLTPPIHRFIMRKGAVLIIEGTDLKLDVIELVADKAKIQTFPENSTDPPKGTGRAGGSISIHALRASGTLTIQGNGEDGAKGEDGSNNMQRAGKGPDGGASETSYVTGKERDGMRCSKSAEDGEPGGQGKPGSNGRPGYQGGDSAKIEVLISEPTKFTIVPEVNPGEGGKGGKGGPGGQGGLGGEGGSGSEACRPGKKGPDGKNGPPGLDGDPGKPGKHQPCCIKVGGKTIEGCGDCSY